MDIFFTNIKPFFLFPHFLVFATYSVQKCIQNDNRHACNPDKFFYIYIKTYLNSVITSVIYLKIMEKKIFIMEATKQLMQRMKPLLISFIFLFLQFITDKVLHFHLISFFYYFRSMSTLKGDLIPYLINKQFVKPPQLEKKDNPYSTDSLENQIQPDISDVQKKGIKL